MSPMSFLDVCESFYGVKTPKTSTNASTVGPDFNEIGVQ